ncbi:hypothetical protein QN345_00595 [Cryobacterium sp. 10I1]|uniref:hypothetical protein n=1 Tax=Cryobacterium sp. 10I1 TaxID=3048578 RepID=UPI002B23E770|nr:hypothetical protein [Cryobacterium sp. 10I1]MEB0303838.1 hypothetical protein [Cryobacterium sp. 10I1]
METNETIAARRAAWVAFCTAQGQTHLIDDYTGPGAVLKLVWDASWAESRVSAAHVLPFKSRDTAKATGFSAGSAEVLHSRRHRSLGHVEFGESLIKMRINLEWPPRQDGDHDSTTHAQLVRMLDDLIVAALGGIAERTIDFGQAA